MLTAETLRLIGFFYANTGRDMLEIHGIIPAGPSGDAQWKRFNNDFDIFLLKLTPAKLDTLCRMINEYISQGLSGVAA